MPGMFTDHEKARMVAAQEIDPANPDDGEYIISHPSEFSPEQVRLAQAAEERREAQS